nr:hypothetical protein [Tanacetum cinerariifolium]
MSNTNTNLQTQTSNALHNAIMEAGGKDCLPMLALVAEGSSETTIEGYMENYKNVSQDIRDQMNAEVEAVHIILTGIDNDIYSTVDACPNECEMWKAIERDDTDDEPEDQELEVHYLYMVQIQEVTPDVVDNFGPIFDAKPLQKVPNNDNHNVFAIESEHPKQPEFINDTYPVEQDEHNLIIDLLDMSYNREQVDQNDDDLANERDLLASLIEKLKCEIDDSKNRNKFLKTSKKALVDKLKDLKKFQAELDRYHDVNYMSKVPIDCAKAKGDLMSYKMESEKSFNEYTRKINDLNQTISKMKKKLFAHQETISIMSQEKEAQIKFYKTREDKEIDKVIALENKVKLVEIILFIIDSGCSKHMTGNPKLLTNFMEKFLGTVKFGNDQIAPILGYGDLGNDLLTSSRGTNVYSITLQDTSSPNPICLMAKVTSSQAWLWNYRLSHLNFNTINLLSKNDIVIGLLQFKFFKDHLCSFCELGKAKRKSFHTKTTPSSKRRLQLLHMDLCGPMRVESINGKKYVLVIVDDYSRYTWTHFLRSKDETPEVLIDFFRLVQR